MRKEVIIVGAGPAGLAAGIFLGHNLCQTLILHRGKARASFIPRIETLLGFPRGISGKNLLKKSRQLLQNYPVTIKKQLVKGIQRRGSSLLVKTEENEYVAKRVLFATGITDNQLAVPEIYSYAGHSIFYCPLCSGYSVQNRRVIVYGRADLVPAVVHRLKEYTPHLTAVITQGGRVQLQIPVYYKPIKALKGERCNLQQLVLAGGETISCDYAFSALGSTANTQPLKELAVDMIGNGHLKINRRTGETNVPGLYAAGDVTFTSQQIPVAAGEGVTAALSIHRSLTKHGE